MNHENFDHSPEETHTAALDAAKKILISSSSNPQKLDLLFQTFNSYLDQDGNSKIFLKDFRDLCRQLGISSTIVTSAMLGCEMLADVPKTGNSSQ